MVSLQVCPWSGSAGRARSAQLDKHRQQGEQDDHGDDGQQVSVNARNPRSEAVSGESHPDRPHQSTHDLPKGEDPHRDTNRAGQWVEHRADQRDEPSKHDGLSGAITLQGLPDRTTPCSIRGRSGRSNRAGPTRRPIRYPTSAPSNAPPDAASNTAGRERCRPEPGEVAHSSPAVNSSESPGRKKPINSPVSANSTRNTPNAPNTDNKLCGSRGFSAKSISITPDPYRALLFESTTSR